MNFCNNQRTRHGPGFRLTYRCGAWTRKGTRKRKSHPPVDGCIDVLDVVEHDHGALAPQLQMDARRASRCGSHYFLTGWSATASECIKGMGGTFVCVCGYVLRNPKVLSAATPST